MCIATSIGNNRYRKQSPGGLVMDALKTDRSDVIEKNRLQCWEFMKCGREKDSSCSAVVKMAGRRCWQVAGTLSGGKAECAHARKLTSCYECGFLQAVKAYGESMKKKRRHKRIEMNMREASCTVLFTEVKIIDLSIEGAAIETTRLLNVRNTYELKLKDKDRTIYLKGTVMWSSLSGTRKESNRDVIPVYHVGLKFTEVPAEKEVELLNFIQTNRIDKGHREKCPQSVSGTFNKNAAATN